MNHPLPDFDHALRDESAHEDTVVLTLVIVAVGLVAWIWVGWWVWRMWG